MSMTNSIRKKNVRKKKMKKVLVRTLMRPPKDRDRGCFLVVVCNPWWFSLLGVTAVVVCLTSCTCKHTHTQLHLTTYLSKPSETSQQASMSQTWRTSFFFLAESGMFWLTCLKSSFSASSVYCWAGDWYVSSEPGPRAAALFMGNAVRWAGELFTANSSRSSWGRGRRKSSGLVRELPKQQGYIVPSSVFFHSWAKTKKKKEG